MEIICYFGQSHQEVLFFILKGKVVPAHCLVTSFGDDVFIGDWSQTSIYLLGIIWTRPFEAFTIRN